MNYAFTSGGSGNVDFKIFELFFASDFIERPEMEKKFLCNEREGFLRSDTSSKPKRHKQHHQVYKNQFSKTNG